MTQQVSHRTLNPIDYGNGSVKRIVVIGIAHKTLGKSETGRRQLDRCRQVKVSVSISIVLAGSTEIHTRLQENAFDGIDIEVRVDLAQNGNRSGDVRGSHGSPAPIAC